MRKNKKQKESQDKLCIDCAKFDNCKFADEDGMACTEYDEVKYILTPKGAWISACMSELGGDESDLELYERFFMKYSHNMYVCGLIHEECKTRIGLALKMFFIDLKKVLTGKKRMNSMDVLFDTMKNSEFEGTVFSDKDAILRVYHSFADIMKKHGHVA